MDVAVTVAVVVAVALAVAAAVAAAAAVPVPVPVPVPMPVPVPVPVRCVAALATPRAVPRAGTWLTVPAIAKLGNLHPRYVTEICGCLACAGFITYDSNTDGFGMEQAQAKVLADTEFPLGASAPFSDVLSHGLAMHVT